MSKLLFVKDFKTISIFDMTVHALENCNLPSSWQDWDQVSGSPDLLKEAYMKVRKRFFPHWVSTFSAIALCSSLFGSQVKS